MKYGFIDSLGNMVVDIVWDQVWGFRNDRCAVREGNQIHYVDKNGRIIPDLSCDAICTIMSDDFVKYIVEGIIICNIVYGIDRDGNKVPAKDVMWLQQYGAVPFFTGFSDKSEYQMVPVLDEQLKNEPAQWGYFDCNTGKVLTPLEF